MNDSVMQFITDKAYYHPVKCTLNDHEIIHPVELRNHILLFKAVRTSDNIKIL